MMIALVASWLTACGGSSGDTPRQFCETFSSTECQQVYACFTPDEIAAAGLPSDESACVTTLDANKGCAAQDPTNACTGGNETFDGVAATKCTAEVAGLTCAEVRALFVQGMAPMDTPACALVCAVH